jgi:hypothetical protein
VDFYPFVDFNLKEHAAVIGLGSTVGEPLGRRGPGPGGLPRRSPQLGPGRRIRPTRGLSLITVGVTLSCYAAVMWDGSATRHQADG